MAGRQSSVSTLDVKAMIGEAKRRSDQRQRRDHQVRPPPLHFQQPPFSIPSSDVTSLGQYMHRLAFAAVRVAPSGFVWLLNVSGKVRTTTARLPAPTAPLTLTGACACRCPTRR
jgi:hypothetical protein